MQHVAHRASDEVNELRAEIERLRDKIKHLEECLSIAAPKLVAGEKAFAEIERLQMELRALRQDDGAVVAGLQGEIERLRAVNDRLMAGMITAAVDIERLRAELGRKL